MADWFLLSHALIFMKHNNCSCDRYHGYLYRKCLNARFSSEVSRTDTVPPTIHAPCKIYAFNGLEEFLGVADSSMERKT